MYNSCRGGVVIIRDVFISQKSRRQQSNQSVPNRRHQWLLGCCRPGSPFNFLEPSSFSTRGTNELIKRLVNFNAFWAHKCNPIRQRMTMDPFIAEDYPFAQGNMISNNFFSTFSNKANSPNSPNRPKPPGGTVGHIRPHVEDLIACPQDLAALAQ